MTEDEFFEALRATPRQWRTETTTCMESWSAIRLGKHCPLSIVAGTEPCKIVESGLVLKMDGGLTAMISFAADSTLRALPTTEHRRMRMRLLEACGLT